MNFLTKLLNIPTGDTKTVVEVQTWKVTWYAIKYGSSFNYPNVSKQIKVFIIKDDAEAFKKALKDAYTITGRTHCTEVEVKENI